MIYMLICTDKPGQFDTRMANRPAHVEHLQSLNAAGKLKFAGPFLDADGKPCGSLVAIVADSEEEARQLAGADPYARAGIFASVEVRPWNWTINNPDQA